MTIIYTIKVKLCGDRTLTPFHSPQSEQSELRPMSILESMQSARSQKQEVVDVAQFNFCYVLYTHMNTIHSPTHLAKKCSD